MQNKTKEIKDIDTINLDAREIIIRINGEFKKSGHKIQITGFAPRNNNITPNKKQKAVVSKSQLYTSNAYMTISNKNGDVIKGKHGILDGLNSIAKPIVFSLTCDPETNDGVDTIGIIILYNNKKNFLGKLFEYHSSKIFAYAHKYEKYTTDQMETIQEKRNINAIQFTASIDTSLTTIIIPDYSKTSLNIESISLAVKDHLKNSDV